MTILQAMARTSGKFRANGNEIEDFARKKYFAGQNRTGRVDTDRHPRLPSLDHSQKGLDRKNKQLRAEGRQEIFRFHATYGSTSTGEFARSWRTAWAGAK